MQISWRLVERSLASFVAPTSSKGQQELRACYTRIREFIGLEIIELASRVRLEWLLHAVTENEDKNKSEGPWLSFRGQTRSELLLI